MIRCRICGRELKDPESVKRGVGPVCWKKLIKKQSDLKLEEVGGKDG